MKGIRGLPVGTARSVVMELRMDYKRIYDELILKGKERKTISPCETHHILPRSMGGSDSSENLVDLTPREHFVAHKLLWKIHSVGPMASAFILMSNLNKKQTGKGYAKARKQVRKIMHERNGWLDNVLYHPKHGIEVITTHFTLNDMATKYTNNPKYSVGNFGHVLLGEVPSAYGWKFADVNLYNKAKAEYKKSTNWKVIHLKHKSINDVVRVHKGHTPKFQKEYNITNNGGWLHDMYRGFHKSKHGWSLATEQEWLETAERKEFK